MKADMEKRLGLRQRMPIPSGFVPMDLHADRYHWYDLTADEYPTIIRPFSGNTSHLPGGSTYYGMVTHGSCYIGREQPEYTIDEGMFFCLPGPLTLNATLEGRGLVIERCDYQGFPQIGGPLEGRGRLRYIDGCSDTLLICPPLIGEPCLNHLHIPPGTNQTAHTHPSQRIGVILRGSGYCLTPCPCDEVEIGDYQLNPGQTYVRETLDEGGLRIWVRTELKEGMGWWIPTGLLHSFHTGSNEFLDVVAWHPDSDFGPQHDNHPMLNRTYVGDQSARAIDRIRTTQIAG